MWTSTPICLSHHRVLNTVQSATLLGSETWGTATWIQIQHNFIRSLNDPTPKQPCLHLHLYPLALSHLYLLSSIHQFSSSKCCHLSTGIRYSTIVILYFCSVGSLHIIVFDCVHAFGWNGTGIKRFQIKLEIKRYRPPSVKTVNMLKIYGSWQKGVNQIFKSSMTHQVTQEALLYY